MPQKISKRQQSAQKRAAASATTAPIPRPFEPAPEELDGFLDVLDPEHVYIVHVDRKPVSFKRQIFAVPVIMNLLIAAGLLYRLYVITPHYLDLILVAMGYETRATIDKGAYSSDELWNLTARRAGMVVLDFFLVRYLGTWAWLFFVGDGFSNPSVSPALWRWRLGCRPAEVVVRASRRWGFDEFWGSVGPGSTLTRESAIMKERLLPNLDPEWMRDRTGYMMMGRDFELDFGAMLHAHDLIDKQRSNTPRDFELCVLVKAKDKAPGWCIWRLSEEKGGASQTDDTSKEDEPVIIDGLSEEQARHRIDAFRQKLVKQDKEELFYRFIELVQYESSQPGGFTDARRASVLRKAQGAFARADLDFAKLVEDLGGEQMLPGFA